jgi:hypothetical protein
MNEEVEPKKRRDRSPSYPAIPIGVAVDKVRDLYQREKAYLTPLATVYQHWGYSPGSGSGAVAVAAALKFGLLEDEGSGPLRRARVSNLGLRIVRDTREESLERDRLLREAALLPPIHRELWEKYRGSLPSDANLKHTLKFEYGFTDVGAHEFAREFRSTIAFARLEEDSVDASGAAGDFPAEVEHATPIARQIAVRGAVDNIRVYESGRAVDAARVHRVPSSAPASIVLSLPIAGTDPERWPSLHLSDRLSESDWQQMLSLLNAMKPAIVASETKVYPESATGVGQAHDATVIVENE